MNRINYDCTFDMADTILPLLEEINDTYPVISVYGKYDVIKTLLEDLIMSGVSIVGSIELECYEVDYYDKEFVLYLTQDGVSTCKCWKYDGYLCGSGNITFIHEDCNSKILKYIDSDVIYEFSVDGNYDDESHEDDDCDIDCCDCCGNGVCEKTKDNVATTSTVSYSVNGKSVSKEEYENKMAEFDKVYRKHLLDMCEMMDEMNEWRKLFRW